MNHVEFYFHKIQISGGFTKYYTELFVYRNIFGIFTIRFILSTTFRQNEIKQ